MMLRSNRWRIGVLALVFTAGVAAMIQPPAPLVARGGQPVVLTSDLTAIPADALGFVHVRVADVWKTDAMADFRKIFEKAGPQALANLDTQFVPAPSTIDRVTMVALPVPSIEKLSITTILAFSKPFEAAAVRKAYLSKAEEKRESGKTYYADRRSGIAVYFLDDKTLAFADGEQLAEFLKLTGRTDGALKSEIVSAGSRGFTACVNVPKLPLPKELTEEVPNTLRPLLAAKTITALAEFGQETTVALRIGFGSAEAATEGEKALRVAANVGRQALQQPRRDAEALLMGRKKKAGPRSLEELPEAIGGLAGLGLLNYADEFLADLPLQKDGNTLSLSTTVPAWLKQYVAAGAASAAVLLPAVQKIRGSAARVASSNNLKMIGLAMHAYHDVYGHFPPAAITDPKTGKKLLSWRVAILPYLEQQNVYNLFKLDEPWDSENNRKASEVAIKTYLDPRVPQEKGKFNHTHYKVFVGKGTMFDGGKGTRLADITDGLSNTVMVVVGGESVPWAKPDDFEFDAEKKLPNILGPFDELEVLFGDGSVRVLYPDRITKFEEVMKMLIQRGDGQVIPDFDR